MEKNRREVFFAICIFLLVTFCIYWKFFLKELFPYPGDFLLAWFEPWKTDNTIHGIITISHKPVADDVFRQIYPFKLLASDLFKKLQLPLWNPYNGAGMPLLATMHAGLLNPLNILFVILPSYLAFSIQVIVSPLLIGFFTFLYCRSLGLYFLSSMFASLSFMLSGFVIDRSIYTDYDFAIMCLPLLLYLVEVYLQNRNTRKIFLVPFVVCFMFFVTQAQIILYILSFVLLYSIYRYYQKKNENFNLLDLLKIYILIILGVGFSAVQIIPTFELLQQSALNQHTSEFIFNRFLLPFSHLISVFVPNYFGNQATYNYWGQGDYIETVNAIGLIPCFFAFLSIIFPTSKKNKVYIFFCAVIIISTLLLLDWFGSRFFYSLSIPIFSTGAPSRIFVLITFSISILAGFGFDSWLTMKSISKKLFKFSIVYLGSIAVLIGGTLFYYIFKISCHNTVINDCRSIALRNTLLETLVFILFDTLFFYYILSSRNFHKKYLPLLTMLIVLSIGLYNSYKFLPFTTKDTFSPSNELIREIQKRTDGRVFGIGEASIKTDFATLFRFYDPNYYDPLYNKRYGELIAYGNSASINNLKRSDVEITNEENLSFEQKQRRNRLLNLVSVKYILYKNSQTEIKNNNLVWINNYWRIFNNTSALPFVYTVQHYLTIKKDESILKKLFDPNFNPAENVILEEKPDISITSHLKSDDKVYIQEYKENNISVKTEFNNSSILITTNNFYPGWKAYVDKKETKIYRANYTFQSIMLPKGKHLIEFIYDPESLRLGIFISLASFITYIFVLKKISVRN